MNPILQKHFLKEKNVEQHANFISRYNILILDLMTESKIFFPRKKTLDSRSSAFVNNAFAFGQDLDFSKGLKYGNVPSWSKLLRLKRPIGKEI